MASPFLVDAFKVHARWCRSSDPVQVASTHESAQNGAKVLNAHRPS